MKKLFPLAIIAVFGLLSFASCTKSSSTSSTCTCTYKNPSSGVDTTVKYTSAPSGTLTSFCSAEQTAYQLIDPSEKCNL